MPDDITFVRIGKNLIGLKGLKEIYGELASRSWESPAAGQEELLRRVAGANYIPSGSRNDYGLALWREFQRFKGGNLGFIFSHEQNKPRRSAHSGGLPGLKIIFHFLIEFSGFQTGGENRFLKPKIGRFFHKILFREIGLIFKDSVMIFEIRSIITLFSRAFRGDRSRLRVFMK